MHEGFARRRRRRPVINITPLIDILLLLLIFFMVSSTFRQDFGVDISLPGAASAVEQEQSIHEIAVTDEGTYYVDGSPEPLPPAELRAFLSRLQREEPESALALRADKQAPFESVLRVIDLAKQVGSQQLIIPTDLLEESAGE